MNSAVSIYDLGNDDDFDALFLCTRDGNGWKGSIIVYSVGSADPDRRSALCDRLEALWDQN